MDRKEFMGQLERLLWDLPEDDRKDALAYYEDYFEAAGPEQEAQVIQDLGSPGKVAAIIKADWREGSRNRGEFTENGYQDDRFQERRQTPARCGNNQGNKGDQETFRKNIWQQRREAWQNKNQKRQQDQSWREQEEERRARRQPQGLARWVWLVLIICVVVPALMGIGGGILGVLGSLFVAALGIAFSGILLLGNGIYHAVIGAMKIAANPASGLIGMGVGFLSICFGILIFFLCVWVAFRIFPRCFRWMVNAVRGIFRHGNRRDGEQV